ncbi:MAG: efflux RND transporter permease subunit [Candidatus Eisenbacteria bacterium]|uniref:Efflux RND transporter permease subunit n=1 Tax=Eiseniibacteriota bacterium TaxID=2212470 RepID=A0A948S020_UNCEI|nr:efflux RND transporter permease subunit [Candidatus Eisenbacteria bacterium]
MTIFTMMFMVIVIGIISYMKLPREASPDVKIPYIIITAPYFGTSPEDMENLVTRKLETQLKGLADLKEMRSTSSEGYTSIVLEFTTDVEMSDALQKVRDAVELAKPELPQDVRDDLSIREISASDWPILQVTLSGDIDPIRLKQISEDLQDEIETVEGVLNVTLAGGVEREVRVDVDPQKMRYYGLSLQDVMDAVSLENVTFPGGEVSLGTYDYQVRVPGEFASIEQIQNVLVNPASSTPVYLRDIADVELGIKDRETISRLNGVDAITLSVTKRTGENILRIAKEIHKIVDEFELSLPKHSTITITGDVSVYIRDMVSELENNILSGLVLVVLVLFMFLGWTNSFFIGSAIPFSMFLSFIVLRILNYTLNIVVLFSLILALGMLVDNAIVIVENIFRFRVQGKGKIEAAKEATQQVAGPVLASTLTTVCAFAPLVFWPGIMGGFMKYLPVTVIITLVSSLLVALVINPVLCSNFMRVPQNAGTQRRIGDRFIAWGMKSYVPTISWALRHRAMTLLGAFAMLIVVMALFMKFNSGIELFPDTDPTFAFVSVEAPSGTRIEVSDAYAKQIETDVAKVPELKTYVANVGTGRGGSGGSTPHLTTVNLEFLKSEYRKLSSRTSLEELRQTLASFTGAKLTIDKEEEGPPTGKPVTIEISGDVFSTLGGLVDQVKDKIRDVPGLVDLQDDYDRGRPEIQIRPNLEKAARLGIRTIDLASMIRTAVHGQDVSKYRVGEDEYDIVIRLSENARKSIEDLEDFTVFYEGNHIPITAFADISYGAGFGAIQRIEGKRTVTVSADAAAGFNSTAVLGVVRSRLADFQLPPGYSISYTGETEDQDEAIAFLSDAFGIAIMLIMLVLISQFTSILVPIVIITSVILSLIGVLSGLMVMRTPFGIIMTGVGVISLAGVVVNNAIVLLDYVIKLRTEGMEKIEAIITAGRTRFRPVILTAVTTILGLIPLTTGFSINFGRLFHGHFRHAFIVGGESSQWWGPMGTAVIWGLAVATFLTLIVVPVMYASIDSVKSGFKRPFQFIFIGLPRRLFMGRKA